MTRLHIPACVVALALAACGGGGDSVPAAAEPDLFVQKASWSVALPASGGATCYDFDTQAVVADCSGTQWDLKLSSNGLTGTLWTNSGSSGSGGGGAFGGPFDHDWSELAAWRNATTDPLSGAVPAAAFLKDAASGAFAGANSIQSAAFEYGVGGTDDHRLYPNYRVFLITTDSAEAAISSTADTRVFALQVTGYYGGASGTSSGHPSLRWIDTATPAAVKTLRVDASASWVYVNLESASEVAAGEAWHIALSRYNVKLNGGASGSAKVAGFVGKTPAGFYGSDGKPVAAKFQTAAAADTLAELTAADMAVPASAAAWLKDGKTSALATPYRGSYPAPLDYGWFSYYPTAAAAAAAGLPAVAHLLAANPQRASMLRSAEGNSYARFHLTELRYADTADARSAQTWTFAFDIQPKP